MDTTNSQIPKRDIVKLQWVDIYNRIDRRLPKKGKCYGIPRGGSIIAGLTGRAVNSPEEADWLVDDIIDSGKTCKKWKKLFPNKPFYAIVDKQNGDPMKWFQFAWEEPAAIDAEDNIVRLLEFLGEDVNREGLRDTPRRVIKAWQEVTTGYNQKPNEILGTDFHGNGYDEMVVVPHIEFYSTCEHHMLPFHGEAFVGYVPRGRVVGLSKVARLVDCFARRLQIQENMTQEIANAMKEHLNPLGVGVTVRAKHLCMSCRGVQKHRAEMVTTSLLGVFKKHAVREEFFLHCQ